MPVGSPFVEAMIGKPAESGWDDVETKRANEAIEAGQAVQLVAGNEQNVEVFDGTGTFYGVAAYSLRADQDFIREDDAADRAAYAADDPVPVLRPGSTGAIVVEFEEDATQGQAIVIDDGTANFRPADTATTPVTAVTHGEVRHGVIQTDDNTFIGSIRLAATES